MNEESKQWVAKWAKDMSDPYLKKALAAKTKDERAEILTCLVMAHGTAISVLVGRLMDVDAVEFAESLNGYIITGVKRTQYLRALKEKGETDGAASEDETESNWS